jgi:hypothetical protein
LRKLGISSLLRLINREETVDDDIALLDYFAIHASDHLLTFQHAIRPTTHHQPEREAKDDRLAVHLAELAPINESEQASSDATVLGTPASALERIFGQLRRRLLGNVGPEKDTASVSAIEVDAGDATPPENGGQQEAQEQRRVQGSLDYFDASMRELVDAHGVEPAKRNSLFVLWLEVTLHMLLRRQSDRAAALAFLRYWFQKASGKCRAMEKVDAMEQHLVTAAALLWCIGATSDAQTSSHIHEALETFWAGAVPAERAARSLLTDSRIGLGGLLLDVDSGQLEAALSEILATRTLRLEIADVLSCYRQKLSLPATPIFEGQTGLALQRELLKRNGKGHFKQLSGNATACPNCFQDCCTSVRSLLRTKRMAVCTSCGWIILRTMP